MAQGCFGMNPVNRDNGSSNKEPKRFDLNGFSHSEILVLANVGRGA